MKNVILINTDGEQLISSVNDGTNTLYINGTLIDSSEWIGTGNYTATIEGHNITIAKIADTNGIVQLIRNSAYNYSLVKAPEPGSSTLIVEDITIGSSISISANSYTDRTISVYKSGYTPLGVVGVSIRGTGAALVTLSNYTISGNTLSYRLQSRRSSEASISLAVTVLYKPN